MLISTVSVFAKTEEVEGLQEQLDHLFLEKCATPEEIEAMNDVYVADFNAGWDSYLTGIKHLGKTKTNNDEDEYEYWLTNEQPQFENGLRVTVLPLLKYYKQYADNNKFRYLFSNHEYWNVLIKTEQWGSYNFTLNGDSIIKNINDTFGLHDCWSLTSSMNMIDFLKDKSTIQNMLLDENITHVDDMRIISMYYRISILYIRSDEDEYIIKIFDLKEDGGEAFPELKMFTIYSVQDFMNVAAKHRKSANATKPTYQPEAEALQSEGLLHGNDNGLDLLKPLSRIEAAAMLLRAIDESEETTQTTPAFTDVPQTHWGYGAAENAYALGIINGVGNNQFAPDKTVTATEFATMLLRSAKEQNFDWTQAINILIDKGILMEEETKTMDFFTRGDMAKIIYEAQQYGLLKK